MIAMNTMWEGNQEHDDFCDPQMEAREDDLGSFGDPRRCPRHPHVKTSSDDGMFDAPCGECEAAMEEDAHMWKYDPANPERPFCDVPEGPSCVEPRWSAGCADLDAEIPF